MSLCDRVDRPASKSGEASTPYTWLTVSIIAAYHRTSAQTDAALTWSKSRIGCY